MNTFMHTCAWAAGSVRVRSARSRCWQMTSSERRCGDSSAACCCQNCSSSCCRFCRLNVLIYAAARLGGRLTKQHQLLLLQHACGFSLVALSCYTHLRGADQRGGRLPCSFTAGAVPAEEKGRHVGEHRRVLAAERVVRAAERLRLQRHRLDLRRRLLRL